MSALQVPQAVTSARSRSALRSLSLDRLLALLVLLDLELEGLLDSTVPAGHRLLVALLAPLIAAPVAFRRVHPIQAIALLGLVSGLGQTPLFDEALAGTTGVIAPALLLCFTVGAELGLRRSLLGLVAGVTPILIGTGWAVVAAGHGVGTLASDLASITLLLTVFWSLGRLWRARLRHLAAFAELAGELERDRERGRALAVTETRMRIGRELQDLIAQDLSAIVLQSAGLRRLIENDPEQARPGILAIESAGRQALADLRRTVGLLRVAEEPELQPAPGLGQLPVLLQRMRNAGLDCRAVVGAMPPAVALPPGVDLLAYRLIETVLMVLIEGTAEPGGLRCDLDLDQRSDRLALALDADADARVLGEQLNPLAARLALYAGALQITAASPGRIRLTASIPLARETP